MPFQWKTEEEPISIVEMSIRDRLILTGGVCKHCKFCSHRQCGPKAEIISLPEYIPPQEFQNMFHTILHSIPDRKPNLTMSCASYNYPPFYACGELFDHPQAKEILEIISEEMKQSDSGVHICSVFSNLDPSLYDSLKKIKLLSASLSANFLEPEMRSKFMNTKDPEREISNVISFINNFYNVMDGIHICILYASKESMKKTCDVIKSQISEDAKHSGQINFLLSEIAYTRYSPKWMQEELKEQEEKYMELVEYYFEQLDEIKPHICARQMGKYMPIQQILEHYKDYERMQWYYLDVIENFRESMRHAIDSVKAAGYRLEDVGFLVARSMHKTALYEYPELNWVYLEHSYYGGNVSAAALTTFEDIKKCIESQDKKYKLYVFTKDMDGIVSDVSGGTFKRELGDLNVMLF